MSIIRIGLAETKHFSEGYAAIFGKKKKETEAKQETPAPKKKPAKPAKKKK